MRLLVIVILIASSGWSAYWFVGKSIRQAALNNWFNEKSENGWGSIGNIAVILQT